MTTTTDNVLAREIADIRQGLSNAKTMLDQGIPSGEPVHPVSAYLTTLAVRLGEVAAALRASTVADKKGERIVGGFRVIPAPYVEEGPPTLAYCSAPALRAPTVGEGEIAQILRQHIKVDATGLSPAVVGHFITGFEEAARAVLAALTTPPSHGSREDFQARVQSWMLACFGEVISSDKIERNHRFLEEALELVQACGCTRGEAHQLVDYVFGRDVGERSQEVGGVMVTLAALCLAQRIDMHQCGETELARIWTKVEKIRAKQAAKPKHSPLPQAAALSSSTGSAPSGEGWVLVPREPPEEMLYAVRERHWQNAGCQLTRDDYASLYQTIIETTEKGCK